MAPTICSKLNKQTPKSIANRRKFTQKAGIYVLGDVDNSKKKFKPLYLGVTNNIRRRISEHTYRNKQHIDRKLKRMKTSNKAVKYEPIKNPRKKEGNYVKCMAKKLKRKLPYNKIGGISKSTKRKR